MLTDAYRGKNVLHKTKDRVKTTESEIGAPKEISLEKLCGAVLLSI